jgi:hypothetical protein
MLEFARSLAPLAAKPPDRKISPGEQERAPAVRRDLPASAGASALACQTIGDPDRLSLPRRGSAGGMPLSLKCSAVARLATWRCFLRRGR